MSAHLRFFLQLKAPDLFESLVIGGAAMQPDLAGGVFKGSHLFAVGALAEAGSDL